MSGAIAVQAALTGLAYGAVLGLVALGITVLYGLTRVLAFAQGDLVGGATGLGLLAAYGATTSARSPDALHGAIQAVVTLVAGAVLSVVVYVVLLRPVLRGADRRRAAPLLAAGGLAAGLAVREGLLAAYPHDATAVPDALHLDRVTGSGVVRLFAGAVLPVRVIGVLVLGLLVGIGVERLLVRTRTGRGMRALAQDPEAAQLVGVPRERLLLLAFLAAGLLAGVAGVLIGPAQPLQSDTGVLLGFAGLAAAVAGGLGSARGALVAALGLGVAVQLVANTSFLGATYADALPFVVLIAALALRPGRAA